ncbi:MAG TPA: DMT family transporter [Rhodopila sp.]|jgi:drug/metabolite transporter (DMT)-like permease|nr:DMT family transporter [Rhodopila sp.]
MGTTAVLQAPRHRVADLLPSVTGALSFSCVDILTKVVYGAGMDVLTLLTLRGSIAVAILWTWLRLAPPAAWHPSRQRAIALVLGVLLAISTFELMEAIALLPVSIAILAYFVYPLFTGIFGAALGVDRLGWRALLTAFAAFSGLALMLGAHFTDLSMLGIVSAFVAAICRVASLILTRAFLNGTDARVTTWYSMVPSTLIFVLASLYVGAWSLPETGAGWGAFVGISVCSTLSTLLVYISTNRIGPFSTALVMNLEPMATTLASVLLLNEVLSPLQTIGAGVMIVSLCAFQFAKAR